MPRPVPEASASRARRSRQRDVLQLPSAPRGPSAGTKKQSAATAPDWPPVPDLFDVITYFRARGDSFTLIASIGFWVGESPTKALTARGLKLWYDAERERRAAAKAAIR
jgi:hypothetical protein